MQTGFLYDPVFLKHDLPGHPENRQRLENVMMRLRHEHMLNKLVQIPFTSATREQLGQVHEEQYVERIEHLSRHGGGMLGPDTYVNKSTFEASAMAAGAAIAAVNVVLRGDLQRVFALVRPPGHHAFPDHGEGFCMFNNIAFAALYALGVIHPIIAKPLQRVVIIDWDVHHGNGTQHFFYADSRVLYISVHQSSLYPGTGYIGEAGHGNALGTTVNIPLPAGVGDLGYARVFDEVIIPLTRRFRPEMIMMSAGYDGHWRDMLANMKLSLRGYADIVTSITRLSDELCNGRIVALLEGGYDLEVLAYGVLNTFQVLNTDEDEVADPIGPYTGLETSVDQQLRRVMDFHKLLN